MSTAAQHGQEGEGAPPPRRLVVVAASNPLEALGVIAEVATGRTEGMGIDTSKPVELAHQGTVEITREERRALFVMALRYMDRIFTNALHQSFVDQDGFFDAHAREIDGWQQKIAKAQRAQVSERDEWDVQTNAAKEAALVVDIYRSDVFQKVCVRLMPCVRQSPGHSDSR